MGSRRVSSSLVIGGRLFLLLLAASAAVAGFVLSRARDRGSIGSAGRYACPMHPEVASSSPGECPICHMALEQVRASNDDASPPAPSSEALPAASANLQNYKVVGTVRRRVFAIEVRAPAWIDTAGVVTAVLYKNDLEQLSPGDLCLFFRASSPNVGIDVHRTREPPAPWDGSTSRVRFRLARGGPAIGPRGLVQNPGAPVEVGWVKLAAKSRELLVVPAGAVLYSSEGPHVLVAAADGRSFSKRRVEIGRIYRGLAVVLSGLSEQEPIVAANAFFLDAEERLQSQQAETFGAN